MSPADGAAPDGLPVADPATVRRAAWLLVRQDIRAMLVVLALTCLASVAGAAAPRLLGTMLDGFHGGADMSRIDLLALAVVGFGTAHLLLTRFARQVGQRLGERALFRLRGRFVERVLDLPTSVVERAGTGDLMTRSSGDVTRVGIAMRDAVPEVFVAVVQVVFTLGAIFLLDPLLGLCGVVGFPCIWLINRWYMRRARPAYLAERTADSRMSEVLAATVEGARTVEAFRMRERRVELGERTTADAYAASLRTLLLRSVLFPVVDLAHAMPMALMLVAGGALYAGHDLSLGTVVAASLYTWQLVDPIDRALMQLEQLQSSGASFARIEGAGQVPLETPPVTGTPNGADIDVTGARYAYDGSADVLRGIDLSVRPGERLAIVGPSGAGKTTLGRLLAGVDAPTVGSVTVGRVPIFGLPPEERRRHVIMVNQEHHIFLGTVRDNLAIAEPEAGDDGMWAALAAVDADWVRDLPYGLDTELGAGGVRLEAGQAQQLALARVVLADPHTVILDEATALLAPTTARRAERSMAAALQGRTVVAIAHRLRTAYDADRIAVMEQGRIIEIGGHHELIAARGPYAALWRSWHGAEPPAS